MSIVTKIREKKEKGLFWGPLRHSFWSCGGIGLYKTHFKFSCEKKVVGANDPNKTNSNSCIWGRDT